VGNRKAVSLGWIASRLELNLPSHVCHKRRRIFKIQVLSPFPGATAVKRKRYVRRGSAWKRAKDAELIPGEPLYEQEAGRFIQCARVKESV
jgi:hypothetical protein